MTLEIPRARNTFYDTRPLPHCRVRIPRRLPCCFALLTQYLSQTFQFANKYVICFCVGPAVASESRFAQSSIPTDLAYEAGRTLTFEIVLADMFGNIRAPESHFDDKDLISLDIRPENRPDISVDEDIDVVTTQVCQCPTWLLLLLRAYK